MAGDCQRGMAIFMVSPRESDPHLPAQQRRYVFEWRLSLSAIEKWGTGIREVPFSDWRRRERIQKLAYGRVHFETRDYGRVGNDASVPNSVRIAALLSNRRNPPRSAARQKCIAPAAPENSSEGGIAVTAVRTHGR